MTNIRAETIVDSLTPVEKVLCLQNVDVFKHATTEMLAYISSIARETRLPRGARIFSQGDVSDSMYVVVDGAVRLEKDGTEILVAHNSDAFGTWALFDTAPRLMGAVVIEDVHLLTINGEDFYDLLADHSEITPAIFKAVIEKVKTLVA
jgi:CRP-like cAMP-binding protein